MPYFQTIKIADDFFIVNMPDYWFFISFLKGRSKKSLFFRTGIFIFFLFSQQIKKVVKQGSNKSSQKNKRESEEKSLFFFCKQINKVMQNNRYERKNNKPKSYLYPFFHLLSTKWLSIWILYKKANELPIAFLKP